MMNHRVTGLLLVALAACTSAPTAVPTPAPSRTSASPTTSSSPSARPTPKAHPVSLPALMNAPPDGRGFRVGRVLSRHDEYTRYAIRYRSGDLAISGIMNRPRGDGPFPVLILAHGYIDPAIYVTGQGLRREQDYLARRGYVVVHVDYRNHASSDDDERADLRLRLGYVEDVIDAARAVTAARLSYVDAERIGLLGRSMGGGVALAAGVVAPEVFDSIVVFAPVSSDHGDNFNRWLKRRPALAEQIVRRYGAPEDEPVFWRNVSPRTFFDRLRAPVVIHHGTEDESVPYRWSRETVRAIQRAGKEVTFYTYEGEHHAFGPQWPLSMRRTVRFFERTLTAD